jgi:hypothetical protein
MLNTASTYAKLVELLTARDCAERYEPHLLDRLPDPNMAFREDTQLAESVAAEYGLEPAAVGRRPSRRGWHT